MLKEIDAETKIEIGQEIWFGEFTAFAREGVVVEVTPDGVIVADENDKRIPSDKR